MSHFGIPVTTQSTSRYGGSSFYSNASSANTSLHKSQLNFSANSSINASALTVHGASKLYAPKSKKIPSRNTWNHTFSIPISCGKTHDPELKLFSDPHVNKLQTGNNRRIVCGGVLWDIYIHPNQGEQSDEFALSCFPVQTTAEDQLPPNYKLKYTICTSLNAKSSQRLMYDDEKSVSKFDAKWKREISSIGYDANPSNISKVTSQTTKYRQDIDWNTTMERLPFSTDDLLRYNCDEDSDYFNLNVQIKTEFLRQSHKRSQYIGVIGAILLESELKLEQQTKEITRLNENKDKLTVTLQTQLQHANKLNSQLANNMEQMAQNVDKYSSEIHELRKQFQHIADRNNQSMNQKEKQINDLQEDLRGKQEEISKLMNQLNRFKDTQNSNTSIITAFQNLQLQAQQQQQQQHILQQQREQQQRQFTQQLAAQQTIHQSVQQQNVMNNNQYPKPQQVISHAAVSNNFNAFSMQPAPSSHAAAPQSRTAPPNTTTVVDQSPQSTSLSQQSPSYHARVVSQPSFNTNTNSYHTNTNTSAISGGMTSSPPQIENFSFGSLSPNKNDLQMPDLENTAEKQPEDITSPFKAAASPERQTNQNAMNNQSSINVASAISAATTHDSTLETSRVDTTEAIISDDIDQSVEEQIFQHRPVRAWRWDKDQEKWRGRGKGQLTIYLHQTKNVGKMVFVDEKHDKTRLLQYIDGETRCEFSEEKKAEIEWFGADYTMDPQTPMVGKWKILFMESDGEAAALKFLDYFNDCIDAYRAEIKNNADEKEETSSIKPFSFDMNDGAKPESFTADDSFAFNTFDTKNTANWASAFKASDQTNNNEVSTMESGSFANMDWNFQAAVAPSESTNNTNNKEETNDEDDNCLQTTFKPIVQLEETKVDTGHEEETLVLNVAFLKLYRFGKDVTQEPCWKIRSTKSAVCFYKANKNGKVRMIARENETNKLRMNQFVPKSDTAAFELRQNNVYQWKAYDSSIAAEEEEDAAGFTLWCIKFENKDLAETFAKQFKEAMEINDGLAGNNEQQAGYKQSTQIVEQMLSNNKAEQDTTAIAQNEVEATQNNVNQDENDEEQYKGWTEEEIAIDKLQKEKAKAAQETAKKFGSGDNDANQVSWNMPNDLFTNNVGTTDNNAFTGYDFESQRGVDLEAEKILNKIQPTNVSFGVAANDTKEAETIVPDFSNVVTTRGNNATEDNAQEPSSGLGMADFSFDGAQDTEEQNNSNNFGGDWGVSGGGFSSVKVTDGFTNATWGNNDSGSGFGSFDNTGFNIDSLISDKKREDTTKDATDFTIKADKVENDPDENSNYTLKPIVSLEEVEVESGHENDKILQEFEIVKLYRWGKDVSSAPCWKARASKTKLQCYQNNDSGKIRIVCRENVTNKLRLNQYISVPKSANLQKKTEKQIQWTGCDATIEEEDQDDKKGLCLFIAKFADEETATKFHTFFTSASQNNNSLGNNQ